MSILAYLIAGMRRLVQLAQSIWLSNPHTVSRQRFTLVWADEFDGPAGSPPDSSKWGRNIGGSGFGNHELQSYTDRIENAFLNGQSHLVIRAIKERHTGPDGIKCEYTSARLLTQGKFALRYGRFEARIKLPSGQGIWPAFWMMGSDIDQVGWPDCSEIDIMENKSGDDLVNNHGTLHAPGYSGAASITATYTLPNGQKFSDDFHVFAVEWEPDVIRFYVDGHLYATRTPADVPEKKWAFDRPCFMLLNLAVGGDWPGNPKETSTFPQDLTVDYVRVYALEP